MLKGLQQLGCDDEPQEAPPFPFNLSSEESDKLECIEELQEVSVSPDQEKDSKEALACTECKDEPEEWSTPLNE